jgi:hypothetical protein
MRYIRKCPKCKSNKGFKVEYIIHGNGFEIRNFKGKVIDCERNQFDDSGHVVQCIVCGHFIEIEKVQI